MKAAPQPGAGANSIFPSHPFTIAMATLSPIPYATSGTLGAVERIENLRHRFGADTRTIWQAARLAPCTERLFREAGIAAGQRVLDLGSGVGDVAMLVAQLVGPSGQVTGVERDSRSIARAKVRIAEAGLHNVSFTHCDASRDRERQTL